MSVVNKKPYIEEKLEKFSASEILGLKTALNSPSVQFHKSLIELTDSDKGIKVGELKLKYGFDRGILAYTNTSCFFLSYDNCKKINIYDINPNGATFKQIKECLSIDELRRCIDDFSEEVGAKKDIFGENVFASDEIELGVDGDFGTNAKEKINNSLDATLSFGESADNDPTIVLEYANETKSSPVKLNKNDFKVANNHLEVKPKLFKHEVSYTNGSFSCNFGFISPNDTEITKFTKLKFATANAGFLVDTGKYDIPIVALTSNDKIYIKLRNEIGFDGEFATETYTLIAIDGTETQLAKNGATYSDSVVAYI